MWRAFFFAVGTMLIILGFECLVAEHFVVTQGRVSKVLAKVLNDKPANPSPNMAPNLVANPMMQGQPGAMQTYSGPNAGLGFGGMPPTGMSKYGPSRFDDSFANQPGSGSNFYGGVSPSSRGGNPQFSLAGFGTPTGAGAPPANLQNFQSNGPLGPLNAPPATRVLTPKDWMPWSLLAAGSLVVLYTNSTARRSYSSE